MYMQSYVQDHKGGGRRGWVSEPHLSTCTRGLQVGRNSHGACYNILWITLCGKIRPRRPRHSLCCSCYVCFGVALESETNVKPETELVSNRELI